MSRLSLPFGKETRGSHDLLSARILEACSGVGSWQQADRTDHSSPLSPSLSPTHMLWLMCESLNVPVRTSPPLLWNINRETEKTVTYRLIPGIHAFLVHGSFSFVPLALRLLLVAGIRMNFWETIQSLMWNSDLSQFLICKHDKAHIYTHL